MGAPRRRSGAADDASRPCHLIGAGPVQQRPVGGGSRQFQHAGTHGREVARGRRRQGVDRQPEPSGGQHLPVEVGRLPGCDLRQDRQELAGRGQRGHDIRTVPGAHRGWMTHAQPQQEPSAGRLLEGGGRHRELDRGAGPDRHDADTDLQVRGGCRPGLAEQQRIAAAGLVGPQRPEPGRFDVGREHLLDLDRQVLADPQPELHVQSPCSSVDPASSGWASNISSCSCHQPRWSITASR